MLENRNKQHSLLNLTPLQKSVLQQLKHNDNIVIKHTDKNPGPAVMDTSDYIQQVLQEHKITNNCHKTKPLTEWKVSRQHLKML